MFRIGHVESPQQDDSRFETLADADIAAIQASYDDSVWAVWADEDGEIVSLVYQQQVFTA